ncbi:hypothetical protein LINGRAPRIM_LOCUS3442 [Linum grandiflorum]
MAWHSHNMETNNDSKVRKNLLSKRKVEDGPETLQTERTRGPESEIFVRLGRITEPPKVSKSELQFGQRFAGRKHTKPSDWNGNRTGKLPLIELELDRKWK